MKYRSGLPEKFLTPSDRVRVWLLELVYPPPHFCAFNTTGPKVAPLNLKTLSNDIGYPNTIPMSIP